jgi:hypothetical protein
MEKQMFSAEDIFVALNPPVYSKYEALEYSKRAFRHGFVVGFFVCPFIVLGVISLVSTLFNAA